MQITLNQDEIFEALETHVRAQIAINEGQEIDIDLKAGRGENGHTAHIDIRSAKAVNKGKATKATKPAASKTKAAEKTPESEPKMEQELVQPDYRDDEPPMNETVTSKPADQVVKETQEDPAPEPEEKDDNPASQDAAAPTRTSIFSKVG